MTNCKHACMQGEVRLGYLKEREQANIPCGTIRMLQRVKYELFLPVASFIGSRWKNRSCDVINWCRRKRIQGSQCSRKPIRALRAVQGPYHQEKGHPSSVISKLRPDRDCVLCARRQNDMGEKKRVFHLRALRPKMGPFADAGDLQWKDVDKARMPFQIRCRFSPCGIWTATHWPNYDTMH